MTDNGWDLANIDTKHRLVLPGGECDYNLLLTMTKLTWIIQRWLPSMISATFWSKGRVELKFGNCNEVGEVAVFVDGTEVEKSKPNVEVTRAAFNVDEGSNLTIRADSRAIIKLFDINIECGNVFLTLIVVMLNTKYYGAIHN